MAFRAYLAHKAEHTHENTYFQEFYRNLKAYYEDRDEDAVIVANPIIDGARPDALFIKNEAICVIDFKDYSGEFHFDANDVWRLKNTHPPVIIKGGSKKNPYDQIDLFRKKMEASLKSVFPARKSLLVNGMVLFHGGKIKVTNTLPKHLKWFHITDKFDMVNRLAALSTPDLYLTEDDINGFLKKHGIREVYKLPSEMIAEKEAQKTLPKDATVCEPQREASASKAVFAPGLKTALAKDEDAIAQAKINLKTYIDPAAQLTFWNEGSAKFSEYADEPIYYPQDVEIPSEKFGYGPFNTDKRPELLMFYYAVRSVVPANVDIDVVSGQYVERYRFTDATNGESVVIAFHYNKDYKFFRNKAQCSNPASALAQDVLTLLSGYGPQKIKSFVGFSLRPWLELVSENMEKHYGAGVVEAKAIHFGANFKLARGKESLTCQAYHNGRLKITSVLIQEYTSHALFNDFKKLLV